MILRKDDTKIGTQLRTFLTCMLGDRNTLYQEIGSIPNNTPADYKDLDECLWLNEIDSLALANVSLNLQDAFDRFFKGTSRYPKFKSKKWAKNPIPRMPYMANLKKAILPATVKLDETAGTLKLPKHKDLIKLIVHRPIRPGGKLKSVTVTLEPDGKTYYSILMEYPKHIVTKTKPTNCIGLDMSLPKLYVDSNGKSPDFPKPYRKMEAKIAQEQRKLSRKKPGSKRYEKQCVKVAKLHAKAKHQRRDILHKISCALTDEYGLIAIVDLDMAAMKQSLKFGKSVSDNGWGMFNDMLEYKAERKGKTVVKIDKWFPSSKTCIACGHIHKELQLSDRTYICPKCGHMMERDVQAAQNILDEALRMLNADATAD